VKRRYGATITETAAVQIFRPWTPLWAKARLGDLRRRQRDGARAGPPAPGRGPVGRSLAGPSVAVPTSSGLAPHPDPDQEPGSISAILAELARIPEPPAAGAFAPGLKPGARIGRFELVRELGRGAFGVVFEAHDTDLRRSVAFKLVRPGSAEVAGDQLRREAETIAGLSHPNLVTLYDVGRCDHGPYLVLELLRGRTLRERLKEGPLAPAEALRLATEVARGLAHAHARGVVHRDLKPSNVFLCQDGSVRLLDFGLAHAFGRRRLEGGTPDYMAPEQWRGAPEDERTDVFALGVLLYRMLAGELPFPDDEGRTVGGPRPAPALDVPDVPGAGPLVAWMLEKDPVDRPRDAGAALAALEPLLPASSAATSASSSTVRVRRRRARGAGVAALAAGVALALVVGWLARDRLLGRPPAGRTPAVLAFADMSPQRDQEYFSDGLAEEIINSLSHVEGLRVVGRTSAFAFKGRSVDLRSIGQQLGVGAVLEGSIRKDGQMVRVTAQLIEAVDGTHLWSQTFDREVTGIFAVQEEIAAAVVAALRVKLLAGREPSSRAWATGVPEAHNQYLLGRQYMRRDTLKGVREAVGAYQAAVRLDPEYAPAWAGLALATFWADGNMGETRAKLEDGRARARAAAEKAVALDPGLADGLAARGFLRVTIDRDWAGGQADLEKALALNPADPELLWRYARDLLGPIGRLDEAIAAARRAIELDPLSAAPWSALAALYLGAGQAELARTAAERSLQLTLDQDTAPIYLATAELMLGRPAEAGRTVRRSPEPLFHLQFDALTLHDVGRRAEARAALDELVRTHAEDAPFQIACVHAWWGEADRAFEWLDRAIEADDGGLIDRRLEPLLAGVRKDPRFAAVLARAGLARP
jgi:serine/threonine protein kinase/tetratricopeptide (TPR) repeat protein